MRLFVAVNFPDEVRKELCSDIDKLRGQSLSGNFSRPENLHLTLAFLGEVHPRRVPDIRRVIESSGFTKCNAVIEGFGSFGGRDGENLFWRSMRLPANFSAAQKQLVSGLADAGFEPDSKPFRPHITLARRCVTQAGFNRQNFGTELPDIPFTVGRISLMRSDRPGGKLTYTEIHGYILE